MPLLEIITNTAIDDAAAIAARASRLTADILSKPESYVMVRVQSEQTLIFAGSNEPAALVKLKTLGLPESNTPALSASICNFIKESLNIDSDRIYIEFSSPQPHMWGWDKQTF